MNKIGNTNISVKTKAEMPDLNKRIRILINTLTGKEKDNVDEFSKKLSGVTQQRLNRIFNIDSRTKKYPDVHSDIIVSIVKTFPSVSANWLLTGEGCQEITQNQEINIDYKNKCEELLSIINEKEKYITHVTNNSFLRNERKDAQLIEKDAQLKSKDDNITALYKRNDLLSDKNRSLIEENHSLREKIMELESIKKGVDT